MRWGFSSVGIRIQEFSLRPGSIRDRKQVPESEGDSSSLQSTQGPCCAEHYHRSLLLFLRNHCLGRREQCGRGEDLLQQESYWRGRLTCTGHILQWGRAGLRDELCKTTVVFSLGTPQSKQELFPSLPSVAGGTGQHVAETGFCLVTLQSPLDSIHHLGAVVWNSSRSSGAEKWKTAPFFLNLIFISGDCLHLCCQSEGHHSTATV